MTLFLDSDELYELTGYRQREKIREALVELQIPFRSRPADGFPLVDRSRFAYQPTKKAEPRYG